LFHGLEARGRKHTEPGIRPGIGELPVSVPSSGKESSKALERFTFVEKTIDRKKDCARWVGGRNMAAVR